MMFALTWRCDGSEGMKWCLRGIRGDGSFYGEVKFQSTDASRRFATTVSGQLSPAECNRSAYEAYKRGILAAGVTDSVAYAVAKGEFIKGS